MGFLDGIKNTLFGSKPDAIDPNPYIADFLAQQQGVQSLVRRLYRKRVGLARKGGDDIRAAARTSKKEVRRAGVEEKGANVQGLRSRGMFNTTLAASLNNRTNESVGRQTAEINATRGQQLAGIRDNIGAILAQRQQFENQFRPDPAQHQQFLSQIGAFNANRRRSGGLLGGLLPGIQQGVGGALGEKFGSLAASFFPF